MSHQDSHQDSDLERALRSRAESFDSSPLTLADVRSRAGRIQRRRRIAASVAAAAAVAIIAPIGLVLADNQSGSAQPLNPSPGVTQSPTNPEGTTDAELGVPYWFEGQLTAASGETVTVQQRVESALVDPATGQWAGILKDDETAEYSWASFDASGEVLQTSPSLGSDVAVTPDGRSYAYLAKISPEGSGEATWQLVKGGTEAQTWDLGAADPRSPGSGPLGILEDGTVVYEFEEGEPRLARPDGSTQSVPGRYLDAADATASGDRIAVQTSYNNDGTSCWAVVDTAGATQAETCEHALGEFSADGRYVVGRPSDTEGLGASSVSILDAQTLQPAATLQAPRGAFIWIPTAWAGDTVLANMWEKGTWTLERLGPDGVLEQRSASVQADEFTPPFQFGAGPLF